MPTSVPIKGLLRIKTPNSQLSHPDLRWVCCNCYLLLEGGFALGSILYQFCGKESPFLIIAALNVADGVMRMLILSPTAKQTTNVGLAYAKSLLTDRQILIGLGKRLYFPCN